MVFFHPKKSPYADLRPQPCRPPVLAPTRAPVPQNHNQSHDRQHIASPPRNNSRQQIAPTYPSENNKVLIRDSLDDTKSDTSATDSGLVWQVNGRRSPRIAISPTTSTASSAPQQDFRGPSLAALQAEGPDNGDAHLIEPLIEDDPRSFDLVPATTGGPKRGYNIEDRAALLTSGRHLQTIFDDPRLYKNFVSWIQTYRADSVPRLTIYRQAKKAIQAIKYSNAITSSMMSVEGRKFTEEKIEETTYPHLEELAKRAFDELVVEDFPAYICSIWVPIIAATVHQRINGALPDSLKQASEGLAEVFCLTDPRQKDDPIVLASKEFTTTTQYGMNFICGQNCRFLQGSGTDPNSVRRVRAALKAQREHSELFLNYRRDGSPFMNLCLLVPLTDFDGNLKYFLGAQVDVSGLLRSCAGFESFARTVRDYEEEADGDGDGDYEDRRSVMTTTANTSAAGPEFLSFAEMLDGEELKTVRRYGGAMHKGQDVAAYADGEVDYYQGGGRRRGMSDATSISSLVSDRPRMLLVDRNEAAWSSRNVRPHRIGDGAYRDAPSPNRAQPQQRSAEEAKIKMNRQLDTMYKDFLLVRPAPSFNITFTSATMRDEDVLQTEFFQHIGGSTRVRDGLKDALSQGHKVTAKVRWSSRYRRKAGGGFGPELTNKLPPTPTRGYSGNNNSNNNLMNNAGGNGGFYGHGYGSHSKSSADEGFWIETPTEFYPSSYGGGQNGYGHSHGPAPPSRSSRKDEIEGELRWIHCTPLVDASGRIGVWVIMLIDE